MSAKTLESKMLRCRILIAATILTLTVSSISGTQVQPTASDTSPSYDQLITTGYRLVKENKPVEGYAASVHAMAIDPARFESYALAALALHLRGVGDESRALIAKALALAPDEKKSLVTELAAVINGTARVTSHTRQGSRRVQPPPSSSQHRVASGQRALGELRIAHSSLGYVNVRKGPSTAAAIVGQVRPGQTYKFSAVSSGWYKIEGQGWIAGRYVSVQ